MMISFSAASGLETGKSKREGRDYNINNAIFDLVKSVYLDWNSEQILDFIKISFEKHENFSDSDLIKKQISIKNPKVSPEDVERLMELAKRRFNNFDSYIKVIMIIANVIEQKCGQNQRGEYLLEVMRGKAT